MGPRLFEKSKTMKNEKNQRNETKRNEQRVKRPTRGGLRPPRAGSPACSFRFVSFVSFHFVRFVRLHYVGEQVSKSGAYKSSQLSTGFARFNMAASHLFASITFSKEVAPHQNPVSDIRTFNAFGRRSGLMHDVV